MNKYHKIREPFMQDFSKYNITEPYDYEKHGRELYTEGKYEEAIICFDQALNMRPKSYYSLEYKAFCLQQLNRYQEAVSYFERILAIESNNLSLNFLVNYSACLCKIGRFQDALIYQDKALAIVPED